MKKLLFAVAMIAAGISASAEMINAVFAIESTTESTDNAFKLKTLRYTKGVDKVFPLTEQKQVVVKYNDTKTDVEKIVKSLKKMGYTATFVSSSVSERQD